MPFTPTSPEVQNDVPVTTIQSKALDAYHIESIKFDLGLGPSNTRCLVQWSVGYNGDQGNYIPVRKGLTTLQGQALLDKLGAQATPGKSRYEDVKTAIWELLQAEGAIPAGTIS